MSADKISRRTALRYAGLISLIASSLQVIPAHGGTEPARGYGKDPNLLQRTITWQRTLSGKQLAVLQCLCDVVLPADPPHPSAGAIGVHDFIDEWVSAPYPQMQSDRRVILEGLEFLEAAMQSEYGQNFSDAEATHRSVVFDRLCGSESTSAFCQRLIELICDGYYTTPAGHAAVGYIGNLPLGSFPEPTPDIMACLDRALRHSG